MRPGRLARAGIALAVAVLTAAGLACDDSNSPNGTLRADLAAARARWAAARITSYGVTERRTCYCAEPIEWTVVVADGTPQFIDSVANAGGSGRTDYDLEVAALDLSMSVEQLFDWIDQQIGVADVVEAVFDPALGYPRSVSVDPIKQAADDEIGWQISGVTPTGACSLITCANALRVKIHAPTGGFAAGGYVVTVTPSGGSPASCAFGLTLGGPCPYSVCLGNASCAATLVASDEVQLTFPFSAASVDVTVEIDGKVALAETVDPDLVRYQPNGALCPPVCWTADVDAPLP